jgi:glycosyltransferase involved in cell wall biosynthesis
LNKRILLITNIPTPYRIPLFNKLNEELQKNYYKLLVTFGAETYSRRKWKLNLDECEFDYKILKSPKIRLGSNEKMMFLYAGLYRLLINFKPDVIIVSGFSIATFKLWLFSFFRNIKYIIWSGSINSKFRSDSSLRKLYRKVLVKRAAGFLAYGSKSKEYLIQLGANIENIFIAINTTDTLFFSSEVEKFKKQVQLENHRNVLLYVGNLTKGKRIELLLKIVKSLSGKRNDFILIIVGDGPEIFNLKRICTDLKIDSMVDFLGFRQKNDLIKYYAQADIFLFPSSYDIWGLVLIEAMASGLPCISSIYAGATADVIKNGITGYEVDFSNTDTVSDLIDHLLNHKEIAKKIAGNAKEYITENVSLKKSVNGFITIIQSHVL